MNTCNNNWALVTHGSQTSVLILLLLRVLQLLLPPAGHRIQAYPHTMYAHFPLLREHSSQASFLHAHICSSNHISVRVLPDTHLPPGLRVANVDQCLAKGHKRCGGSWTADLVIHSPVTYPFDHDKTIWMETNYSENARLNSNRR